VLRGEARIELRSDVLRGRAAGGRQRRGNRVDRDLDGADERLLAALKELRLALAREQAQPAYVIFPDRTLLEMAALRPATLDQMRGIHGVGQVKLDRHGQAFLETIRRHLPAATAGA
jgi:ATP-dependent DNA helicase RecQ